MEGLAPEVILSVVFGLQRLVVAWRSGNDLFVEARAWWKIAEKIQMMRNFSGLYFNSLLFFGYSMRSLRGLTAWNSAWMF